MIQDLKIIENGDGGDFVLQNNDLKTIEGLGNQVYLAFFGGDSNWFGNELMNEENQFNSKLETELNKTALNSAGLIHLISTAELDLKFLSDYADVEVDASITGINKIDFEVTLTQPDTASEKITFIWDGTLTDFNNDNTN